MFMTAAWIICSLFVLVLAFTLGWRWACRKWNLPCPTSLAWLLENRFFQKLSGTETILKRMALKPGQRILEIGPGPGRLLLPAARLVQPGGEVVGVEIQPGMVQRLSERAKKANLTNLTVILGDATQPQIPVFHFDVAILCTVLGEVPDRAALMQQIHRALKPGGLLHVTEMFGDPHYQSRSTVRKFAQQAGFQMLTIQGHWWLFTATFSKS